MQTSIIGALIMALVATTLIFLLGAMVFMNLVQSDKAWLEEGEQDDEHAEGDTVKEALEAKSKRVKFLLSQGGTQTGRFSGISPSIEEIERSVSR